MGSFVIGTDPEFVGIGDDSVLHPVHFLWEDAAAVVFHHLVGAGLEKARVDPAVFGGHRVLGLIAVVFAGGRAQDRNILQLLTADAVQAGADPLGLQPQLFFIVHVMKIAAAA